jgi:glycosyltransferase involved in cell wall biosynthesis
MTVSVILCTVNRAAHLKATLESLAGVEVPGDLSTEIVVVDNGSTDGSAEVARLARLPKMQIRVVHEPERGLSRARNRGLTEAKGSALLFIDDDVRPDRGWLAGMAEPILSGRADAVAGAVAIAPHLERPWMTDRHRAWLAATVRLDFSSPTNLIGANMAVSRDAFDRVGPFDPELGAGALGFGEESLLVLQLLDAGCRIAGAPGARVTHYLEESRLARPSWLDSARRRGQKAAFLAHHWHHEAHADARRQLWIAMARLSFARARRPADTLRREGCAEWEMMLIRELHFWRQYLVERKRPPKYRRVSEGTRVLAAG